MRVGGEVRWGDRIVIVIVLSLLGGLCGDLGWVSFLGRASYFPSPFLVRGTSAAALQSLA